jgi:hypothetical protein
VLPLERAVFHRLGFARSLDAQLRAPRNQSFDPVEFVRANLDCHVDVLIRTANAVVSDAV